MSSRRDQVDAQRYMMARVTGALVRAEPETSESPTRRDRTGTMVGLVLGIVLLGATAVWALYPGSGSTRWQQGHMLIMDASSGARYVLVGGQLRPVNDIATATLLAGGRLTPITVPTSELIKVPRGEPVGTPDGPQVLPSAAQLNQGVWRACDQGAARIVLDVDAPAGRQRLAEDEALPVAAGGQTYLLWGGRRQRLTQAWVADVLGLGLLVPVPVSPAWLDLIPAGGDVGPPVLAGAGGPGPAVAGKPTTIGQTFRVDLGNATIGYYAMTADGLAPLTETEYLLEHARPGAAVDTAITAANLAATTQRPAARRLTDLPATPPKPRAVQGGAVCVEYTGRPDDGPSIVVATDLPTTAPSPSPAATTDAPTGPTGTGSGPAVTVRVAPGGGALLLPADQPTPSQAVGVLVDDRGVAYPVRANDINTLGYRAAQAVAMPPALVALLPAGPALSRPEGG